MHIMRWQESTPPQEHELRARMQQQGLSPYSWSNGPYDTYAVHSHSYEKVLYCVRGSIRFTLPDQPEGIPYIDLEDERSITMMKNWRSVAANERLWQGDIGN